MRYSRVRVHADRSLASGVGASFCHRWFPTLARGRRPLGARCGFSDPYGATMSTHTRLGSQGGAVGCGGVPQRTRHVSIARAPKVPAMPRRGSGGFPQRSPRVSN
eukprot:6665526-Prymnesium_polylepis.2